MPRFFFTLSFLKSFFQKYQDNWFEGISQENQESFIRFLRCQNGHILIDDTLTDLENYPHLYSIFEPSTTSYRPFLTNDTVNIPDFIPEELEDEFIGILSHAASFTNSIIDKIRIDIQKKYFKPIFTQHLIEDEFVDYSKTINTQKGKISSWEKILSSFKLPTGSIIISDNFLLTRSESIENNLVPILNYFSKLRMSKLPVVILSAKKANINYASVKQRLEQRFNREYSQSFKIEIVFVEGGIKEEHDRRIISDTMSLSVPHGLDLLKKGISRGTTEPSIISFFDGKKENTDHLVFLKKELKKSIDEGRLQQLSL